MTRIIQRIGFERLGRQHLLGWLAARAERIGYG